MIGVRTLGMHAAVVQAHTARQQDPHALCMQTLWKGITVLAQNLGEDAVTAVRVSSSNPSFLECALMSTLCADVRGEEPYDAGCGFGDDDGYDDGGHAEELSFDDLADAAASGQPSYDCMNADRPQVGSPSSPQLAGLTQHRCLSAGSSQQSHLGSVQREGVRARSP